MLQDLAALVSDPTDFPSESDAPGLRKLDSAFRCSICQEIFDAPMMLLCGHSFCSLCARQHIREKQVCPQCRATAQEMNLMKNTALEELGMNWRQARKFVLDLLARVIELEQSSPVHENPPDRPRKKRKISSDERLAPRAARTNASPGPSRIRGSVGEIDGLIEIEDSERAESEGEILANYVPSSDTEENDCERDQESVIACPACGKRVRMKHVNVHLDSGCASHLITAGAQMSTGSKASTKNAWQNMFNAPSSGKSAKFRGKGNDIQKGTSDIVDQTVERLPKPSYSVLKEKQIREMLAEHGLSSMGSKAQLVARHNQYVLLFNANLDRPMHSRKTYSELRKELRDWENVSAVKKADVENTQAYLKANNADFKRQIEETKARMKIGITKFGRVATEPPQTVQSEEVHDSGKETMRQVVEDTVIADSEGDS